MPILLGNASLSLVSVESLKAQMEIMFVYCFTDTRPDACSPAVIWFYVSVHLQ